jgi:four helix bundle protein
MITSYKDLEVYKESYQMFLKIHKMTQKYPDWERYEIGAQLRKAAMSIPMNIAEGYGKKSSELDFKRFLKMALGSCNEVQVLVDMSKDLSYITQAEHKELTERYDVLGKRLNTLIRKWKSNF